MDGKKLAFETAMTQAASVAQKGLSPNDYQEFLSCFSEAWAAYDAAVFSASNPKKETVDKRISLSLVFGLKREG